MTVSVSAPVVVIHSSCGSNTAVESEPMPKEEESIASLDLPSLPISCDILMLPEIPKNIEQKEKPLLLRQSQFNPCGLSNVLLLENLLWKDVLLSLSSCSIKTPQHEVLPIQPQPSTFFFAVQEGIVQSMSELNVHFDFTIAELRWIEMRNANEANATVQESNFDSSTEIQGRQNEDNKQFEEIVSPSFLLDEHRHIASFYAEMCLESLHSQPQQEQFKRTLKPEERVLLVSIQKMVEKEAHELDRLLGCLAIIGLCLFGLLLWSGYQVHRSTERKDQITKTQQEFAENHSIVHPSLTSSESNSQQDTLLPTQSTPDEPQLLLLVTSLAVNRKQVANQDLVKTMLQSKGLSPILLDGADPSNKTRRNKLFEISGVRANYPQLFVLWGDVTKFVGDFEYIEKLNEYGSLNRDYLLANASNVESQGDATPPRHDLSAVTLPQVTPEQPQHLSIQYIKSSMSTLHTPSDLSPCSKFEKEWTEKKTVRRSNRRKKAAALQPTPCDSIRDERNDIPQPPLLGPPQVVSSSKQLQEKTSMDFGTQIEAFNKGKQETGNNSFLSPTQKLPELCSTPHSKEDSFIDDYW